MKAQWIIVVVFGIVGLGMGAGGAWFVRDQLVFRASAVQVEGIVAGFATSRGSKGGTMYAPRVRYVVPEPEGGGREYEIVGSVRSGSRGYDLGEAVAVWYQPGAPAEGRMGGFVQAWLLPSVFGFFALIFGGVALGMLIGEIGRIRTWRWLEHSGMRVQARLVEVARNTRVKVNGRSPWVLRAQWQHPVTRAVHVFDSEDIWFDPTPFVGTRSEIGVRLDPDDPSRHRVDIGWLPKKG